jgi:hypothetical protein
MYRLNVLIIIANSLTLRIGQGLLQFCGEFILPHIFLRYGCLFRAKSAFVLAYSDDKQGWDEAGRFQARFIDAPFNGANYAKINTSSADRSSARRH